MKEFGGFLGCGEMGWERRTDELDMDIYTLNAVLSLSLRQL